MSASNPHPRAKPVLSSTTEFPSQSSVDHGPVPTSVSTDPPALRGAISDQKGLSKSQAAGIPLPSSSSERTMLDTPPLGPPSSKRSVTRSVTLPNVSISEFPVPVPAPDSTAFEPPKISPSDHFAMKVVSKLESTLKAFGTRTDTNVDILAGALFVLEKRVDSTVLDVGNLTAEVRLRPRQRSESPGPTSRLTWAAYGGVQADGPRSHSSSRSSSSESSDRSQAHGYLEELENRAETITNELDARIAVLERREPSPLGMSAETIERFGAISGDLVMLNDALFSEQQERDKAYAALLKKTEDVLTANGRLRHDNRLLRAEIDTIKSDVASSLPISLHGRDHVGLHQSQSPAAYSVSHPPRAPSPAHYSQPPSRPRSRSPVQLQSVKRPRTDFINGFISFGPLGRSAETPVKLFELHLRTAIPQFRLEKYTVEVDRAYTDHLRVTLPSTDVARALMTAWARNNVAGYSKIKMFEMVSISGRQRLHATPAGHGSSRDDSNHGFPHPAQPSRSSYQRPSQSSHR
ncbi:hypothetical protein B0H11DRAFT_2269324 [Mycena galericulata]|nr:hypothetical protein B0H11DRAFT_2269324 [Mycena galericulata]